MCNCYDSITAYINAGSTGIDYDGYYIEGIALILVNN